MRHFIRGLVRVLIVTGALFALGGGLFIGLAPFTDVRPSVAARFHDIYLPAVGGILAFAILVLIDELIRFLRHMRNLPLKQAEAEEPGEEETPAPAPQPAPKQQTAQTPAQMETVKAETPRVPDARSLYKSVRTYIELEMWELAIEKANVILRHHPRSPEAVMVRKIINDLRWKAEPKFVAQPAGAMTREREQALKKKGITTMLSAVKAYVDLEMWDMAREKAMLIINNFPDSDEAKELAGIVKTIAEREREAARKPPAATPEIAIEPAKPQAAPQSKDANAQAPPAPSADR